MVLKTIPEIELMDAANRIVHEVLDGVAERIRPGVTTLELDRFAEDLIRRSGAVPGFLNYKGYPATLCTSVNDVIVHGIPQDASLEEGDIVGVDCGVLYRGYYGDAARTFAVGAVDADTERLLTATREALDLAVEQVRVDAHLSDIGQAVESRVTPEGFAVVREFVGHGIGASLHEDPQVPNYGPGGRGPRLKPGLVLAIEPMVNVGSGGVKTDSDGWTARTDDGSKSAHFEYSVAVTADGPRVLGRERAAA